MWDLYMLCQILLLTILITSLTTFINSEATLMKQHSSTLHWSILTTAPCLWRCTSTNRQVHSLPSFNMTSTIFNTACGKPAPSLRAPLVNWRLLTCWIRLRRQSLPDNRGRYWWHSRRKLRGRMGLRQKGRNVVGIVLEKGVMLHFDFIFVFLMCHLHLFITA